MIGVYLPESDLGRRARFPRWICTGFYPRVVTYELVIKLAFVLHGIKGEQWRITHQTVRDMLIKAEQTEVSELLRPSMYAIVLQLMRDEGFRDFVKFASIPSVAAPMPPNGANRVTRPGAILDELSDDDPPDIVLHGSPLMKY
jgi:hypothetical protein